MLGLLAGDGANEIADGENLIQGSCLGQLACFTVEGFIRGLIRFDDKGIGSPVNVAWQSWARWAKGQGLKPVHVEEYGPSFGWLSDIASLRVRQGSAPATVAGLQTRQATMEEPLGRSFGHHALTRVAPVALFGHRCGPSLPAVAREMAATTHGHPDAWEAAAAGALLLAAAMHTSSMSDAVNLAMAGADTDRVRGLLNGIDESPPESASHSLVIAARLVSGGGAPSKVLADARGYSSGAAAYAGALLGALAGADGLTKELAIGRLELAWIGDRLARDAVREQAERPGFMGYYGETPKDPMWRVLYPPW